MKSAGLLVLFSFFCLMAAAQQPYWQQQVNYNIDVTLNDADHSLVGSEKMEYFNNSGDTLHFIWMHLWLNAYKNDRTAFTEQMLKNGSTDFYFSNAEQRGYINRMVFKVDGSIAVTEDHPQHQDIVKILLPVPLAPHKSCMVETPFHVKLPYNFSRGGHVDQSYQITQWYPKAAVYDKKGWHEMPYLDQGEFYSDFGNYEVAITLPENYVVAATGELVAENKSTFAVAEKPLNSTTVIKTKKPFFPSKKTAPVTIIPSSKNFKTLTYKQNDVIDFAWFADKNFEVKKDTVALPSGKIINVAAYSLPGKNGKNYWRNAVKYIKKTVLSRSQLVGEYPYNTCTAVQAETKYSGGMEYPTITLIAGVKSERAAEGVIAHEVGHNWFYGILASNEREHPWMDEGMNTYYDLFRYVYEPAMPDVKKKGESNLVQQRMPDNYDAFMLRYAASEKSDQPVETPSEKFSVLNYELSAYYKAGKWMQWMENNLGRNNFDSCMRAYYQQWKFKHPYPEDFKAVFENVSKKNLEEEFLGLATDSKGVKFNSDNNVQILNTPFNKEITNSSNRKTKVASFFSFKDTDKYKYLFVTPVIGVNLYDKAMVGLAIHNYTLPAEKIQFFLAGMYATGSKQLNGIGTLNYHWFPKNDLQKIEIGLNGSRFSSNHSLDTTGKKIFENYYRVVPFVKFHFRHAPGSNLASSIDIRSFIIGEKSFSDQDDNFRPRDFKKTTRYVNQLSFTVENSRVLYPYNYQLQVQQGDGFYRVNATGNYFFNYAKGGGMNVRLFAAKFGYIGGINSTAYLYQPKLLAGNGTDDYTNSSYFMGRTASTGYDENIPLKNGGLPAQQVMIQNTGGLKLRLDTYGSVQGYSDNWVAAVNISSTLPEKLFPVKLPLKVFFDAGSYAEAWDKLNETPRFLYVGGLQLSVFKNVLNIYVPLIYSKAIKEQLQTNAEDNKFFKKITFSIDLQNLTLKKIFPQFAF